MNKIFFNIPFTKRPESNHLSKVSEPDSVNKTKVIFQPDFGKLKSKIRERVLAENKSLCQTKQSSGIVKTTTNKHNDPEFRKNILFKSPLVKFNESSQNPTGLCQVWSARTSNSNLQSFHANTQSVPKQLKQKKKIKNQHLNLKKQTSFSVLTSNTNTNICKKVPFELNFKKMQFKSVNPEAKSELKKRTRAQETFPKSNNFNKSPSRIFCNLTTNPKNEYFAPKVKFVTPKTDLNFIKEKLQKIECKIDLLKSAKIINTNSTIRTNSPAPISSKNFVKNSKDLFCLKNNRNFKKEGFLVRRKAILEDDRNKQSCLDQLTDLKPEIITEESKQTTIEKIKIQKKKRSSERFFSIKTELDWLFDNCEKKMRDKLHSFIEYHHPDCHQQEKERISGDLLNELIEQKKVQTKYFEQIKSNFAEQWARTIKEILNKKEKPTVILKQKQLKMEELPKKSYEPDFNLKNLMPFEKRATIQANRFNSDETTKQIRKAVEKHSPNNGILIKNNLFSKISRVNVVSDPGIVLLKMENANMFFRQNIKLIHSEVSDLSHNGFHLTEKIKPMGEIEKEFVLNNSTSHKRFSTFQMENEKPTLSLISDKKIEKTFWTLSNLKQHHNFFEETCDQIIGDFIHKEIAESALNWRQKQKILSESFFSPKKVVKFCKAALEYFCKHYSDEICDELNKPFGPPLPEKLHRLKKNQDFDLSINLEVIERPVLTRNASNKYLFNKNSCHKSEPMIKSEKSHNNMLLDCLNEILCGWKKFALKGVICSWRCSFNLKWERPITRDFLKKIVNSSIVKIQEWSEIGYGITQSGNQVDSFYEKCRPGEVLNKNAENLTRLLNIEMNQNAESWTWYEDHFIETIFGLEKIIWEKLVEDSVIFLLSTSKPEELL